MTDVLAVRGPTGSLALPTVNYVETVQRSTTESVRSCVRCEEPSTSTVASYDGDHIPTCAEHEGVLGSMHRLLINRKERLQMPITSSAYVDPPVRIRGSSEPSPIHIELEPYVSQQIEQTDAGNTDYLQLKLTSEEEAKQYGNAFHVVTGRKGRHAQVRYFGDTIFVKVREADYVPTKRTRKPKPEEVPAEETPKASKSGK